MKHITIVAVIFLFWGLGLSCKQEEPSEQPVYFLQPTDTVRAILKAAYKARSTDLNESLNLYKEAISTGKKLNDKGGLIRAYRSSVFVSSTMMHKIDTALSISDEALVFAHNLNDPNTLCDMYGMRAVVFQVSGNTDSATFYNNLALHYMDIDTAPDSLKNWPLYLNVADLYSQLDNQKMAIEFTEKYLNDYALKIEDTMRMISSYNNLGVYYTKVKDTTKAYFNTREAWRLYKLKPNRQNHYSVHAGMFAMYNNEGKYDSARYYNQANINLMQEEGNKVGLFLCISNQMEIAVHQKSLEAAKAIFSLPAFSSSYRLFDDDKVEISLDKKRRFAENLSVLYKLSGKESEACKWLQEAYDLNNELSLQKSNKDLEEFELGRKKVQQENALLVKQIQIENKNNTIIALMALLVLILCAGISIYVWYSRKHILQQKEMELMRKEQEWEQNKLLLQTQFNERNRISKELHDDLGASLTAIVMEANMLNSKEVYSIKQTAQDSITSLNEIVWTLNGKNDSLYSLFAYIRRYTTDFLSKAKKVLEVEEKSPEDDIVLSSSIRRAIFLTVKECLNNIVKHSEAAKVMLNMSYDKHIMQIVFTDNGKGLAPLQNLNGHGLTNMRSNIENIGGTFNIFNNVGTQIVIELKIYQTT